MINKRLLVKKLLAHNDENSFYDKKQRINLGSKIGKAKFIKVICALANSNPTNNSYVVIGVEDKENKLVGVDFYDDSKIQNLVNSSLENPPKTQYENIHFPGMQKHKVIALITISGRPQISSLKKRLWKYERGLRFYRRGSNSMSTFGKLEIKNSNEAIVKAIEKSASNNLELTLNGVFDFIKNHKKIYKPTYRVFQEQFVVCWAGLPKKVGEKVYYSRVDIELVNEQVRLFYSSLDEVKIQFNRDTFIITEYVFLKLGEKFDYHPFEKTIIHFKSNGRYKIVTEVLFDPPQFNKEELYHEFNNCNTLLDKLIKGMELSENDLKEIKNLPTNYLICVLNDIPQAQEKLLQSKPYLKALDDKLPYIKYKEAVRVIRKMKD